MTLVELGLDFYMFKVKPEQLIGDRAYGSDLLDAALAGRRHDLISPHRKNRKTQDAS
ncbi:MAG TPA: hypothetical protein VEY92_03935 [Pseudoxanthomonas sp.]|nr:hypothetical protein [Pseudoxanthomonas sp.]